MSAFPSANGEGCQPHVAPFLLEQGLEEVSHAPNQASSLEGLLMTLPKLDMHFHLNGSISLTILEHMKRIKAAASNKVRSEGLAKVSDNVHKDAPPLLSNGAAKSSSMSTLAANFSSDPCPPQPGSCVTLNCDRLDTDSPKDRMLSVFDKFDEVYKIMTNLPFTRLAVQDLIWHTAAENVLVLELRSSPRDKLQWSIFQAVPGETNSRMKKNRGREASKEDYLQTVIDTVEHLLRGGVVDLETGELCHDFSQSDLLDYATSPRAEPADGPMVRWWTTFAALYGGLAHAPVRHAPSVSKSHPVNASPRGKHAVRLFAHLHHHLCCRMQVRLLVSVNRGTPAAGAWQALALAAQLQREQLHGFHTWLFHFQSEAQPEKRAQTHTSGRPGGCNPSNGTFSGALGDEDGDGWARALLPRTLAQRLRTTCWVTGLDFSGNCYKGDFGRFRPAFEAARGGNEGDATATAAAGGGAGLFPAGALRPALRVTLHGGEKPDPVELAEMVAYHPDRWGHLVFTDPTSLGRILAAHDPIELCLTSNLITSGHDEVGQHHLTTILATAREVAWSGKMNPTAQEEALPTSEKTVMSLVEGLLEAESYAVTLRQHVERRFRRYRKPLAGTAASKEAVQRGVAHQGAGAKAQSTAVIPNISFHTDDRGILGITLTNELLTLLEHPDVLGDYAVTEQRVMEAMWRLERLAIAHVFELPWAILVMLVAARVDASVDPNMAGQEAFWWERGDQPKAGDGQGEEVPPRVVARKLSEVQNWSELKESWSKFEEYILLQQELADKEAENPLGELWSRVELAWLTQCFDEFYTNGDTLYG